MLKGLTDEVGSRQLYMSSLYEYLPLFETDPEGRAQRRRDHAADLPVPVSFRGYR